MIEEIQIAQLDPRQIKQLEAADKAFSKDPNYSFEVFSAILKQSPNCLELRKKLRLHQLQLAKKFLKQIWISVREVYQFTFLWAT